MQRDEKRKILLQSRTNSTGLSTGSLDLSLYPFPGLNQNRLRSAESLVFSSCFLSVVEAFLYQSQEDVSTQIGSQGQENGCCCGTFCRKNPSTQHFKCWKLTLIETDGRKYGVWVIIGDLIGSCSATREKL